MRSNGKVVGFVFPWEDAELLKRVAENRGEDVSSFIRRAVYQALAELSYLDADRKKALGIARKRPS
jgi:hypothetical protein